MNSICLMGRLTTNPELKTTQGGNSVTSFSIAVDRTYTPKGQEKQTDFINCVAWRNTAEFIGKFFRKGQRIALQGSLQSRKYTANDGSQRTVYEVVVDTAFFCESKNDNQQNVDINPTQPVLAQHQQEFEEVLTDEDLPF